MIKFSTKFYEKPKKIYLKYPEVLNYECLFEISINDVKIFKEPNFPIYEFYIQFKKWILEDFIYNYDFEYVTMESDLNPLIKIVYYNNLWEFIFLWHKFESNILFTANELINAFNILEKNIFNNVKIIK